MDQTESRLHVYCNTAENKSQIFLVWNFIFHEVNHFAKADNVLSWRLTKQKDKILPPPKNSQKFVKWGQWFNTRSNSEKVINFKIADFSMFEDFLPKIDASFL